ncbi:MAG: hypothetical protein M1836_007024 [Candelina mexicana]|nr:MAG: hypothetical protein M1836_007024 [Candelina mexicana]
MKCSQTNEDTFGAATVRANGVPCAEYNTSHSGRHLSCWVHVDHRQTITIDYEFRTRGVCYQVDLIVDGFLRETSTLTSKKIREFRLNNHFETAYYKRWKEPFDPAKMVVAEVHTITNSWEKVKDTPIGTIELRFYSSSKGFYHQHECMTVEDSSKTYPYFGETSLIGPNPDLQIKFEKGIKLRSPFRSTIRSKLNQSRPGHSYWASFKFNYRQEKTLRSIGYLDRPSIPDIYSITTAPLSPSLPQQQGTERSKFAHDDDDGEEAEMNDENGVDEQTLDIASAAEMSPAEVHNETTSETAEQVPKKTVGPKKERVNRGHLDTSHSETPELAFADSTHTETVKRESESEGHPLDQLGISSLNLASDSFRLRRTSSPSSNSSEGTHSMSPTFTRASASSDRLVLPSISTGCVSSTNSFVHDLMRSPSGPSTELNKNSALMPRVQHGPDATTKRGMTQNREVATAKDNHTLARPEDRPSKRPRMSVKALEAEDEKERRLEEAAEREWEELKRKKEEAEVHLQSFLSRTCILTVLQKRVDAKLQTLQKSIEDRRRRREERERLNEELRREVRSLDEDDTDG